MKKNIAIDNPRVARGLDVLFYQVIVSIAVSVIGALISRQSGALTRWIPPVIYLIERGMMLAAIWLLAEDCLKEKKTVWVEAGVLAIMEAYGILKALNVGGNWLALALSTVGSVGELIVLRHALTGIADYVDGKGKLGLAAKGQGVWNLRCTALAGYVACTALASLAVILPLGMAAGILATVGAIGVLVFLVVAVVSSVKYIGFINKARSVMRKN